jgi:hypothetical protein
MHAEVPADRGAWTYDSVSPQMRSPVHMRQRRSGSAGRRASGVRPGWHAQTMARTQAVYYRDLGGAEPVDEFIEALPPKRAAKINDFVEEYLNGQPPEAPPPVFPVA